MKRLIVKNPSRVLREKSKEVAFESGRPKKAVLKVIRDLKETIKDLKEPEGQGLSAPQIGENLRVFAIKMNGKIQGCINPKIIEFSKETNFSKLGKEKCLLEGCLSLPNIYGEVERPYCVEVIYQDQTGGGIKEKLEGIDAICFQHESDHLEGILFIDHVLKQKGRLFEIKDGKWSELIIN